MKKALWILQGILALMFFMPGLMKLMTPYNELGEQMAWATRVSPELVLFIGVCEILGAIGIILPSALRIMPIVIPIAAAGLSVIMLLGVANHMMAGETMESIPPMVLATLSGVVGWGRLKVYPILSK